MAVFTIKRLKWAIAVCERVLIVPQVFGTELKSMCPVCLSFVVVFVCVFVCCCFGTLDFFSLWTFFFSPQKVSFTATEFVFSRTIPMPGTVGE